MKKVLLNFKGVSDGVYLDIKGDNLEEIKRELDLKLNNSSNFFQGAKFLGVRSDELGPDEILEIKLILKYRYNFEISNGELPRYIGYSENEPKKELFNVEEGMTKFIHGTLRSGQVVEYDGNIVIIGDVNPGAFLKARGNIVVLGTLRGVAHAGDGGNHNAIVAAYSLLPTQLRIGDIIVRPPDGDTGYKLPEIAKIVDGEVFIEPYLPNK